MDQANDAIREATANVSLETWQNERRNAVDRQ